MNLAPAARACSTCSTVRTVPAPTHISGSASAIAAMHSAAQAVPEGDLGGLHASCHKGVGERSGVLDLVEHNDRHDAQGLKRGVELIEHDVPFDVWRAWARDCQMCWSGADFGLVIGGTAWGSSNSKTGCSTSHVGNARQNRNGTGGFARPEESGSGPQGYGIGKLRPAEWRRTSARRGCHRRRRMPRLRSRLR